MMDLYIIKCDEGYLRKANPTGFKITSIEKASVFNDQDDPELNILRGQALRTGLCGLRLVKLSIKESVIRQY